MSTKNIAVDSKVYDRLAAAKREGESFSKTIDRLLSQVEAAHTGADIIGGLGAFAPLSNQEAEAFLAVIAENRSTETWDERDLR
jgi:predicted CopG family antitoxin